MVARAVGRGQGAGGRAGGQLATSWHRFRPQIRRDSSTGLIHCPMGSTNTPTHTWQLLQHVPHYVASVASVASVCPFTVRGQNTLCLVMFGLMIGAWQQRVDCPVQFVNVIPSSTKCAKGKHQKQTTRQVKEKKRLD